MNNIVSVYSTFSNQSEAEGIINSLLDERLIACANIIGETKSFYRWEGKRETSIEVVVIMKTKEDLSPSVIEYINKNHSYDCPCVVVWPITDASKGYLEWINDETLLP